LIRPEERGVRANGATQHWWYPRLRHFRVEDFGISCESAEKESGRAKEPRVVIQKKPDVPGLPGSCSFYPSIRDLER